MHLMGERGYLSLVLPIPGPLAPRMSTSNTLSLHSSDCVANCSLKERTRAISPTDSLICHVPNEVVPILRNAGTNLFNAEGILARVILSVGRVLMPNAGQDKIELPHGHADKVGHMCSPQVPRELGAVRGLVRVAAA